MTQKNKLHLGSGTNTPKGWIHIDASWNAKLAKHPTIKKIFSLFRLLPDDLLNIKWSEDIVNHDLTKPLPFPNDLFDVIYSSHLIEHLYKDQALELLKECHRVLRKGGIIRTVVPDLESAILEYIGKSRYSADNDKYRKLTRADRLQERILLRPSRSPSGNLLIRVYNNIKDYNTHKWMYDEESLAKLIKDAGFSKIKRRNFHQSKIDNIGEIELAERFEGGRGLCIEAEK